MSGFELKPPFPVYTDLKGEPLEAGKLFFGVNNLNPETNPIEVFFDALFTVPAAQPIRTLAGYPVKDNAVSKIFTKSSDYSITVRDKNDELIFATQDQTTDIINIKDFGAVGDGLTDDTAAINAALEFARGVFFPKPDVFYKVDGILLVPENTRVFGEGFSSHVVGVVNKNIFTVTGDHVVIENIQIEGPDSASAFELGNGVISDGNNDVTVRNCWIHKFIDACPIQIRNGKFATIENNFIWNNQGTSEASDIVLYQNADFSKVINNYCLGNNSQGIWVNSLGDSEDLIISGNHCIALANDDTFIEVGIGLLQRRHGIEINYEGAAIGGRANVGNNNIRNTRLTGIYSNGSGGLPGTAQISIVGNTISRVSRADSGSGLNGGILMINHTGVTVSANTIDDCFFGGGITIGPSTAATDPRITIIGNDIINCQFGLLASVIPRRFMFNNNTINNSSLNSILVQITAGNIYNINGTIKNNNILHTSIASSAIKIDPQDALGLITIEGNLIIGTSNSEGFEHIGINVRSPQSVARVRGNTIENMTYGVGSVDPVVAGRIVLDWGDNHADNCSFAYLLRSNVTSDSTLVEEGVISNGSGLISAGGLNKAGYIGRFRDGGAQFIFMSELAPTVGTWVQGDRTEDPTPVAAGFGGRVCVTGGNPGTWKGRDTIET